MKMTGVLMLDVVVVLEVLVGVGVWSAYTDISMFWLGGCFLFVWLRVAWLNGVLELFAGRLMIFSLRDVTG